MTMIKICGLVSETDALTVKQNKADLAGMVLFYPKSKRNIDIQTAKHIMRTLGDTVKKVAVVVSPSLEQIEAISSAGFDFLQIHGTLDDDMLSRINMPILKAFNVTDLSEFERYQRWPQIKGYVFDAGEPGSGKTFDWDILKKLPRDDRLFLLAGGLTVDNVAHAISYVRPDGVDVSSYTEYTDGITPGKDPLRVEKFISEVRSKHEF